MPRPSRSPHSRGAVVEDSLEDFVRQTRPTTAAPYMISHGSWVPAGAPFYTARTTPGLAALICQTGRDFGASERTLERYGTRLPAID